MNAVARPRRSFRHRVVAVAAGYAVWALVVPPIGAQVAHAASADVIERMHAYLDAYEPLLSALVADEVFDQRHQFRPGFAKLRRLESEIGFLRLPGGGPWLAQRSVQTIDGAAVPGGAVNLEAILAMTGDDRFVRARAVAEGNARHNLGHARTMNVPTLPLELLSRRHTTHFDIAVERRATGRGTALLVVREHEPGQVIAHDAGRFNRTAVRAWIRADDGALLRADVTVYAPSGGTEPDRIRVDFRADATLGMLVPDRLEERYWWNGEGRGTAVYRRYRRFQTAGRVLPPAP